MKNPHVFSVRVFYLATLEGEIVSVAPATLKDAGGLVSDIRGEYFDIRELAAVWIVSVNPLKSSFCRQFN